MAKAETSSMHPWLKAVIEWGKGRESWFSVRYGSDEWCAWADYFRGIGYMPKMFRGMRPGSEWTAPTRWPSAFDMRLPEFAPADVPFLMREREYDDRQRRENLDELRNRFGSNWGIGRRPPKNEEVMMSRRASAAAAQAALDRYADEARRSQPPQSEAAE